MSRSRIERRFRKIQADAKALGVELLTEESTFIDDDHLDCVWYGGYIGGFKYKGYEVSIEVRGEVEVYGFMNGRDFHYQNKQNTDAMDWTASDTLRTTFHSDADFWSAMDAGTESDNKVWFENNSWVEAFVFGPDGKFIRSDVVDDADNVLDACCNILAWVNWLEENVIEDKEGKK